MQARVGSDRVEITFEPGENLTHQGWQMLLDELHSEHIPGFYQDGRRSAALIDPITARTRVLVYLTKNTVDAEMAKAVLHKWNIELVDENGKPL